MLSENNIFTHIAWKLIMITLLYLLQQRNIEKFTNNNKNY